MSTFSDQPTQRLRRKERSHRVLAPSGEKAQAAADLALAAPVAGDRAYAQRYVAEGALGEGAMGVVSLVRDRHIGRSVAVKSLHDDRHAQSRARTRFLREARVQGQLEHPSIVPVYDLGRRPDGRAYFSMRRVQGQTLEEVLDELDAGDPATHAAFSRRRLLSAFSSVCLAVHYAHTRGVAHRDLKPANVMLGAFGEVYVLDWGVAKLFGEESDLPEEVVRARTASFTKTRDGTLVGSPAYMAPEQLLGDTKHQGPASDIYALGAMLFEILTYEPLHTAASFEALVAQVARGVDARPSVRAPELPDAPELDAICVRATALVPDDRFPSARALHDAVEAYLEGEQDAERRRALAAEHAGRAVALAAQARADGGLEARRGAMGAIGRALALEPESPDAMQALIDLLEEPPRTMPEEVVGELDRSRALANRRTARIGVGAYLSMLLYVPVMLLVGVRSSGFLIGFVVMALVNAGVSAWTARQRRPPDNAVVAVMIGSNIMLLCALPVAGALVLLPPVIVANTVGFAVHLTGWRRIASVVAGCLTIAMPTMASWSGLRAPRYRFGGDVMEVLAEGVQLGGAFEALLLLTAVAAVVTGAVAVASVRDQLRDAERRLYLYAWHLREFVPAAARQRTDATLRQRRRSTQLSRSPAPRHAQATS